MDEPKQEFNGQVGDVAGRDVVNHIYHQGRPLTKDERIALNSKVNLLNEEYGEPGWKTWKFLHRTIGVEGIDEMRIEHRDSANAIIDLLLERASLAAKLCSSSPVMASELQNKLDGSAQALTRLTQQNADLASRLGSLQKRHQSLEQQYTQQSRELLTIQTRLVQAQQSRTPAPTANYSSSANHALAQTRKNFVISMVVAVMAIAAATFFSAQAYSSSNKATAAEAQLKVCAYGGHSYTLGSIIDNQNAADLECVPGREGTPPQWRAIASKASTARKQPLRKSKPRKKHRTPQPMQDTQNDSATPADSELGKLF